MNTKASETKVSCMASDLPLEIINEIINQTDDRFALCNWALTCKHLSLTAQKRLWSNLVISIPHEHLNDFPTFRELCTVDVPRERRKCLWVKRLELNRAKPAKIQLAEMGLKAEAQNSSGRTKRTVVVYKKGFLKRKYESEKARQGVPHGEGVDAGVELGSLIPRLVGGDGNSKGLRRRGNKLELVESPEEEQRPREERFADSHEIEYVYHAPLKWENCSTEQHIISKLKQVLPRLQNLEEIVITGDISEVVWQRIIAICSGPSGSPRKGVRSIIFGNCGLHTPRSTLLRPYPPTVAFTGYPVCLEELEVSRLRDEEAKKLGTAISLGGSYNGIYPVIKKKKKHQAAWRQLKHLRVQECGGVLFFLGLVGQNTRGNIGPLGLPPGLQSFMFNTRQANHWFRRDFSPLGADRFLMAFDACANSLTSLTLATPNASQASVFESFYKVAYFPNLTRFSSPATNGNFEFHDRNLTVDNFQPFLERHGNTLKALHIHRLAWSQEPINYNAVFDLVLFDFYEFLARAMVVLEEFTYGCVDGNARLPFSEEVSRRFFASDGALGAFIREREARIQEHTIPSTGRRKAYSMIERLRVAVPWLENDNPPHAWIGECCGPHCIQPMHKDLPMLLSTLARSEMNTASGLKILLLFPSLHERHMEQFDSLSISTFGCINGLTPYISLDEKRFTYVHGNMETKAQNINVEWLESVDLASKGIQVYELMGRRGIAWVVAKMFRHLKVIGIGDTRFWIQRQCEVGVRKIIEVWNLSEAASNPELENIVKLDLSADEWKFLGRDKGMLEAETEMCCERMAFTVYDSSIDGYRKTNLW